MICSTKPSEWDYEQYWKNFEHLRIEVSGEKTSTKPSGWDEAFDQALKDCCSNTRLPDDFGPIRSACIALFESNKRLRLKWLKWLNGLTMPLVPRILLGRKLRKLYCLEHEIEAVRLTPKETVNIGNRSYVTRPADYVAECSLCGRQADTALALRTDARAARRSWWTAKTWRSL